MKKLTVLLLALVLGGQVIAEEQQPVMTGGHQKEEGFFERLRKKIELLTPKKKLNTAKAVGGVRGARVDADELYWKQDQDEQAIDADELAAIDAAIARAEAGEMAAAEEELNSFISDYPDSRLREDAENAIRLVQAQAAESETQPLVQDEFGSDNGMAQHAGPGTQPLVPDEFDSDDAMAQPAGASADR